MSNYKPDWSKAPHDAQFFSCGFFRKYENGSEYRLSGGQWFEGRGSNSLDWHKKQPDFELRPEAVQSDALQNETKYTHYISYRSCDLHIYTKCLIVSDTEDKHGNIVVLNDFGFYKIVPPNEVHPIRTKRDKWVEAALSDRPKHAHLLLRAFAESIYDAMKDGKLEKPE